MIEACAVFASIMTKQPHDYDSSIEADNNYSTTGSSSSSSSSSSSKTYFDVVIVGSGPAGIAAARYLSSEPSSRNDSKKSINFVVLEARNRVGGRAYTSDSLHVNKPLDHGARWIHGTCAENRIIQILYQNEKEEQHKQQQQQHVDDGNINDKKSSSSSSSSINIIEEEYKLHLPQHVARKMEMDMKTKNPADTGTTSNPDNNNKTPPPFSEEEVDLSNNKEEKEKDEQEQIQQEEEEIELKGVEHMILRNKDRDKRLPQPPTRTWTKLILPGGDDDADNGGGETNSTNTSSKDLSSSSSSSLSKRLASKVFKNVILSTFENPPSSSTLSSRGNGDDDTQDNDDVNNLETASLMDLLLVMNNNNMDKKNSNDNDEDNSSSIRLSSLSEQEKCGRFATLCRHLVETEIHTEQAKKKDKKESDGIPTASLQQEVLSLLHLKIYTFFESWEGAPIHRISAKYGGSTTCLPGSNTILPFGYGGLMERLARPLLQENLIKLQHQAVSIETTTTAISTVGDDPQRVVIVRCKLPNGEFREFHALACIVALPLGVLQDAVENNIYDDGANSTSTTIIPQNKRNTLTFIPNLPTSIVHSIQSLGIAVRNKIELLFSERWWPENIGKFLLANVHLNQSPTYHPYTTFLVESASSDQHPTTTCVPNILVCYVAGEFAERVEQQSDDEIRDACMQVLRNANVVAVPTKTTTTKKTDPQNAAPSETDTDGRTKNNYIPDPIAVHITRWRSDPYSRGSWTFYGKGSKPADVKEFRTNTDCIEKRRLFFAGEHTCDGSVVKGDDMGCVHGAWVSGELAAKAAMKSIGIRL